MPIIKDRLTVALSSIRKDEEWGYYENSQFLNLYTKTSFSINKEALPRISAFIKYILNDLQIIETIINRMAWQNDLRNNDQLDEWNGCLFPNAISTFLISKFAQFLITLPKSYKEAQIILKHVI